MDRDAMAMKRTKAEMADIVTAFFRGDGAVWARDDFVSVRVDDRTLLQ
jgi:hypothetical protein